MYQAKNIENKEEFDYSNIDSLAKFEGTHPAVLSERLKRYNWKFDFDASKIKLKLKDKVLLAIEKQTGYRAGEYKNYKII